MRTCDGLSLTEVLVSLVLVTSASLALIQQQSHVNQYTHQLINRNDAITQLDNASEQLFASRRIHISKNYQFSHQHTHLHMQLRLSNLRINSKSMVLKRNLVYEK
jgi:Tfp pilus assembly protein PilV